MNPVENASGTEWIVRVADKEYGPVALAALQQWKAEGRLISTNEVRPSNSDRWRAASEIPGLFATEQRWLGTEQAVERKIPRFNLLAETLRIYRAGFLKFVGLTLLVIGPAICGQVITVMVDRIIGTAGDLHILVGSMINFCTMTLTLVLTPVYIAGIQLLTAELHFKRDINLGLVVSDAAKFWPRITVLWAFVFLCYAFWAVLPIGIILAIAQRGPSFFSIFLILFLLAIQVWMTGRLFINFLFWQQFAVLDCCGAAESLRRSKALARSRSDLPWFRRPMWRGVFIASLWFAVVLVLNWPAISVFYQASLGGFSSTADPQVLVEQLSKAAQGAGGGMTFAIGVTQALLKPLLGIAFVLLYFDSAAG